MTTLKEILLPIAKEHADQSFFGVRFGEIHSTLIDIKIPLEVQETVVKNLRTNIPVLKKAINNKTLTKCDVNVSQSDNCIQFSLNGYKYHILDLAILPSENFNTALKKAEPYYKNKINVGELANDKNTDFLNLSSSNILTPKDYIAQLIEDHARAQREAQEQREAEVDLSRIKLPQLKKSKSPSSPLSGSQSSLGSGRLSPSESILINTNQQTNNMEPNIAERIDTDNKNQKWLEELAKFVKWLFGAEDRIDRSAFTKVYKHVAGKKFEGDINDKQNVEGKLTTLTQEKREEIDRKCISNYNKYKENNKDKNFITYKDFTPNFNILPLHQDVNFDMSIDQDESFDEELLSEYKPDPVYSINVTFEKGLEEKNNERMVITILKDGETDGFFNFDASSCKDGFLAKNDLKDMIQGSVFDTNKKATIEKLFQEKLEERKDDPQEYLKSFLKNQDLTFVSQNSQGEDSYVFGKADIEAKIESQKTIFNTILKKKTELEDGEKKFALNKQQVIKNQEEARQRLEQEIQKRTLKTEQLQTNIVNAKKQRKDTKRDNYIAVQQAAINKINQNTEQLQESFTQKCVSSNEELQNNGDALKRGEQAYEEEFSRALKHYGFKDANQLNQDDWDINKLDPIKTEAFFTVAGINKKVQIGAPGAYKPEHEQQIGAQPDSLVKNQKVIRLNKINEISSI